MYLYIFILLMSCFIAGGMNRLNNVNLVTGNISKPINTKRISFFLIFVFLSFFIVIRDGVGCDYNSYIRHILIIQSGNYSYMEAGFQAVVKLLAMVDPNPRFVIIVFGVVTCFFYIRAIWDQSDDITFSIFIFIAWGYYFLTFNTIRNYFALALALCSIKYINRKKPFAFIMVVLFASLFHKSALVCIPVYFLAKLRFKKRNIIVFCAVTVLCLLSQEYLRKLVFFIYPGYLNGVYDTGRISYLNIVKAVVVLCLGGLYYKHIENDELCRFYFNLNVFSLMFYVGMYWVPEVSRIGFYMNATSIMFIPRLVSKIDDEMSKTILKMIIIVMSFLLFVLLLIQFSSPTTRLLPYQSWLFDGNYAQYSIG